MITKENVGKIFPNKKLMTEEEFLSSRKFKCDDIDFSEVLSHFENLPDVSEELQKYAIKR